MQWQSGLVPVVVLLQLLFDHIEDHAGEIIQVVLKKERRKWKKKYRFPHYPCITSEILSESVCRHSRVKLHVMKCLRVTTGSSLKGRGHTPFFPKSHTSSCFALALVFAQHCSEPVQFTNLPEKLLKKARKKLQFFSTSEFR